MKPYIITSARIIPKEMLLDAPDDSPAKELLDEHNDSILSFVHRDMASHLAKGVMDELVKGPCVCQLTEFIETHNYDLAILNEVRIEQSVLITPIVNCGECKYSSDKILGVPSSRFIVSESEVWCPKMNMWKYKNGFCDLGKRKENKQ